jgi:hypothetical protein
MSVGVCGFLAEGAAVLGGDSRNEAGLQAGLAASRGMRNEAENAEVSWIVYARGFWGCDFQAAPRVVRGAFGRVDGAIGNEGSAKALRGGQAGATCANRS